MAAYLIQCTAHAKQPRRSVTIGRVFFDVIKAKVFFAFLGRHVTDVFSREAFFSRKRFSLSKAKQSKAKQSKAKQSKAKQDSIFKTSFSFSRLQFHFQDFIFIFILI
jgi:hypothetical protein